MRIQHITRSIFVAALLCHAAPAKAAEMVEGIQTDLSYIAETAHNFSGGIKKGTANLATGNLDLTIDTDKAGWWPGGTFLIDFELDQGANPSTLVGDFQTLSNIADQNRTRLQQFWYQQELMDGSLSLLIGTHDLNSEFDVTEYGSLFLNSSFGIQPDISGNVTTSIFPIAGLGVRALVQATDQIFVRTAIYDGDPNSRALVAGDGKMLIGETGWVSGQSAYKVGIWRHTARHAAPDGKIFSNDSGGYIIVDQPLTRWSGGGLGAFLQYGQAQSDRNVVHRYLGLGLHVTAPFEARPDDEAGIAMARTDFTTIERLTNGTPKNETAFELTYHAQLLEWLALQPSFQLISHPASAPNLPTAKAILLRGEVSL
ncbi:MAG: carbohydrate porin [Mariprofundales bacterium]